MNMEIKNSKLSLLFIFSLSACGGGGGSEGDSSSEPDEGSGEYQSNGDGWQRSHDYDFTEWDKADRLIQIGNDMYSLVFEGSVIPTLAKTTNGLDFEFTHLENTTLGARNITHMAGYDFNNNTFLYYINSISSPNNPGQLNTANENLSYEITTVGDQLVSTYGYEEKMRFNTSVDGGYSWEGPIQLFITNTGETASFLDARTNNIEFLNRNNLTVYNDSIYVAGNDTGVWISASNDPSTWTLYDVQGESVVDIAAWNEGQRVFCTTKSGKIYWSTDAGEGWHRLTTPSEDGEFLSYVQGEIPIGVGADGTLIVAGPTGNNTDTTKVWISDDMGSIWTQIDDAPVTLKSEGDLPWEPKLYITDDYYWYSYAVGNYFIER